MGKISKENSKEKHCIIWDGKFPEKAFNLPIKPIYGQDDFEKYDFMDFEIIFILVELKWSRFLRSAFYGFKLAAKLRRTKLVHCPIVFCTFMADFNRKQCPDSKILDYPGHYLLKLTEEPFTTENFKGLDLDTLEDVNISLFDPNQQIHDLMHNTENRCPELAQGSENKAEIKTKVLKYLSDQLKTFKNAIIEDKVTEFENLKMTLFNEIEQTIDNQSFTPDKLRKPLNNYKEQFYNLLPSGLTEGSETNSIPKRWQVLYIDDQLTGCESIFKHFERNGITCHIAQSAEQAFTILKEDENGSKKIAVIISDFRLYVNGDSETGKWQDLQGYQILKQVHSHHEFKSHYAYVMLTSKKGTIQQYIKKKSNFPIQWFNKADVLTGEYQPFNIFCQRIIELGSEAFFKKHAIPAFGGWKNAIPDKVDADFNYEYLYKLHIEDTDYEKIEAFINELALQYSLLNEFSDEFTLSPSFQKKYQPDKMLNKFRETILLYRRIFLKLKFVEKKSDMEIFTFFKPRYSPSSKIKDITKSRSRQALSVEELHQSQLNESIKGLFHANWGFQLNLEESKMDESLVTDLNMKFLKEESIFLKNIYHEFPEVDTDDEVELISFFDEIISFQWPLETKMKISTVRNSLNNSKPVRYFEIKGLFSILRDCCDKSEELKQLVEKTEFIKYYKDSFDFISKILAQIIKDKLL